MRPAKASSMSLAVASQLVRKHEQPGRRTAAPLKADGFPRCANHPRGSQLEFQARSSVVVRRIMVWRKGAGILTNPRCALAEHGAILTAPSPFREQDAGLLSAISVSRGGV